MQLIDPTTFIIASLATYRLARAIAEEEGPFGAFLRLRGRFDADQATWIGRGLNCTLCTSFWLALPAALFISVLGYADGWAWPVTWLGIAGAVVLVKKWEQKR